MNFIDCLLTPFDLYRAENNALPRLAIMGTCVAGTLVDVGISKGLSVEYHVWDTWTHVPFPDIEVGNLDGIIIHLTLRTILNMADGFNMADGNARGDVSYINLPIEELRQRAIEIITQRIEAIVKHFANKIPLFFLSFIEPPQTTRGFYHDNRSDSIYRLVRDINDEMCKLLQKLHGAYYVEVNDILSYYGSGDGGDSYHNHFTHGSTQSENFYIVILQRIVNALETLRATDPVKLIVTDLDNTLWNGVPAEEDEIVPWRHTEGWPIGYVEALLECKRRGILLAVCSKNNEIKTLENFRKIWQGKIQPEDFFSLRINWNQKSKNIDEIIQEANVLPSSVLFIDDNPLEIEEVKRVFPEIRTLSIPQKRWRNVLLHAPQTQSSTLSTESQNRTETLKAKVERDKLSARMDRNEYLHSLELRISITEIREASHPYFARTFELLNKTNQFNTTGQRWTENDLQTVFLHSKGVLYAASVEDRLANYGITAVAVVSGSAIIQFVLSCRIFGLDIETALLHKVMQSLRDDGVCVIKAVSKDTGRNASSRDFYSRHGFTLDGVDDAGMQTYLGNHIPDVPPWIRLLPNM